MVTHSNNVQQVAAWNYLYPPHPAKHFVSSHKQEGAMDSFSIACVWIGSNKVNRYISCFFDGHTECVICVCPQSQLRLQEGKHWQLCEEGHGTQGSAFITSHMPMRGFAWICGVIAYGFLSPGVSEWIYVHYDSITATIKEQYDYLSHHLMQPVASMWAEFSNVELIQRSLLRTMMS